MSNYVSPGDDEPDELNRLLPKALAGGNDEITDADVETMLGVARDPNAPAGRYTREPKPVPVCSKCNGTKEIHKTLRYTGEPIVITCPACKEPPS